MDERPFLDAILSDPADDAPRLIYADWLDEEGRCDRAEFIRVQVELASRLAAVRPPGPRLVRRQKELFQGSDARGHTAPEGVRSLGVCTPGGCTLSILEKFLRYADWQLVWRRGFVEDTTTHLPLWTTHGPALAALHPLAHVTLTGVLPIELCNSYPIIRPFAWRWGIHNDCWVSSHHHLGFLPRPLHAHLHGGAAGNRHYTSEREAIDDLSAAAIAWARAAARVLPGENPAGTQQQAG